MGDFARTRIGSYTTMNWLFKHTSDESSTKGISTAQKRKIARGLQESSEHNVALGFKPLDVHFGKGGIKKGVEPVYAKAQAGTGPFKAKTGTETVAPRNGAGLLT